VEFNPGLKFRCGELDSLSDQVFQLFAIGIGRSRQFNANPSIIAVDEGVSHHPKFAERFLGDRFDNVRDENL
jgi:hypothetical protein